MDHVPQETFLKTIQLLAAFLFMSLPAHAQHQHGITTDPNAATGFIVENAAPHPTAKPCNKPGMTLACDADGRPVGHALLGQKLPDIKANFLDGTPFKMGMIDRWTVIHVWGVWCGDSRADAPFTAQLSDAINEDPSLAFLSIHVPVNAARTRKGEMFGKYGSVSGFLDPKGYSYPTVVDTDGSVREALKIAWTPSYLLVSPDGDVRGFRTDLSVSGDQPVKRFLAQIKHVQAAASPALHHPQRSDLSIGPEGALNLTGPTLFTAPAMEAAFPDLTVVADRSTDQTESYPVYHIRSLTRAADAARPFYTVTPTWTHGHVQSVSTRHPDVVGPNDWRIQKTRLDDVSEDARTACYAGTGAHKRHIICPDRAEQPKFMAIFGPTAPIEGKTLAKNDENQGDYILIEMKFMPDIPIDAR